MRSYISVWINHRCVRCSSRKNSRRVNHDLRERKDSEKESNDRENEEKPRVLSGSRLCELPARRVMRNHLELMSSSSVDERAAGYRSEQVDTHATYARNKRTHSQSSRCERRDRRSGEWEWTPARITGWGKRANAGAKRTRNTRTTLDSRGGELHGASGVDRFRLIRYRYRRKWRLRFCAIFRVKSNGSPYPRDNWMREPFMRRLINFIPREVVDEGTVAEHVHVSFE